MTMNIIDHAYQSLNYAGYDIQLISHKMPQDRQTR